MKKLTIVIAALLLLTFAGACNLVSVNEEKDMARSAIKVGDIEITKGEIDDYYQQYLPYASYFGIDSSTPEGRQSLVEMVLDELLEAKVIKHKALERGFYNFTEEQKEQIQSDITENYDYFVEQARAMAEDEFSEDPDINVEERASELLKEVTMMEIGKEFDEQGLMDFLNEYFEDSTAANSLMESISEAITVSDEEVRAAYDELLASYKSEIEADPNSYQLLQEEVMMYEDPIPQLYVPENFIRVRVISVYPETEPDEKIQQLQEEIATQTVELGNLALQDEDEQTKADIETLRADIKAKEEEVAKLLEDYLAPSKQKITEAYEKLTAGADFSETLLEYDSDIYFSDYEVFLEKGRLMGNYDNSEWPEALRTATFALTTPNSYTEIIEDTEGQAYYIAQYLGTETPGEIKFETVRDAVAEDALLTKQSDEWTALVDEWKIDQDLVSRFDDVISSIGA